MESGHEEFSLVVVPREYMQIQCKQTRFWLFLKQFIARPHFCEAPSPEILLDRRSKNENDFIAHLARHPSTKNNGRAPGFSWHRFGHQHWQISTYKASIWRQIRSQPNPKSTHRYQSNPSGGQVGTDRIPKCPCWGSHRQPGSKHQLASWFWHPSGIHVAPDMEPAWSKVNPKVIKMNVLDAKWAPIGHQSVFVGVPTHDQDQKTNWSFDFDIRLAFIWQTISPFAFSTHVAPIWHEI